MIKILWRLGSRILLLYLLCSTTAKAQFGFCTGNTGDPIFTETFGEGLFYGPPLANGSTSYQYVGGSPIDGSYTISNATPFYNWHNISDHTPNDTNGKSFVVNADYTPGEFFKRKVAGLCENTSYEFSSWLINLLPASGCNGNGIPINVKFQIWDDTETNLLASGDTGNIHGTETPIWRQYGLVFQTLPSQTSVVLKMLNNGVGGCGNDLAIDDIVFKSCGDYIELTDAQNKGYLTQCETAPATNIQLTATPDFSIYNTHAYQWQQSSDRVNWTDLSGENSATYTSALLTSSTYFRVKMAEDAINLANSLCSTISDVYEVLIVPQPDPPQSDGDILSCVDQNRALSVSVPEYIQVDWYDAPIGGNLLLSNSNTYTPQVSGTYYAEAVSTLANCYADQRTAISMTLFDLPEVSDETLSFCENTTTTLSAKISNMAYEWNTGETTESINVTAPGIYTVKVTNANGCSSIKTISLQQIDAPKIQTAVSEEYTISILTENSGEFEFSLDGFNYQNANVFNNTEGGLYTLYVRERNNCGIATLAYIHLVIPKFFTPNGDGINDLFKINGLEKFNFSKMSLFDRYGNLIKTSLNSPFEWDGTFNGKSLPASDYWFQITINDTIKKGHFTLKR
ncbi:T9SS type B sorting domain-containing protein [Arenibacter sp. M-2]|uniref:T9SS type B sorting domain-containing protein n=1 Tax=Arenibacter sp. M-2 TaxID=3053612 RepID=UPI002570BB62|nr:T9SS type B sorting domain-containing protein [Arenibacter sp. M-2]MDL5510971.1 T9SS type B sorting domain-containing protein [Arenibacter sp. M-2]